MLLENIILEIAIILLVVLFLDDITTYTEVFNFYSWIVTTQHEIILKL